MSGMSDFFVSLDALNNDSFYQDTRTDLDMDLALSRRSRVHRSHKENIVFGCHDREHAVRPEPTGQSKQTSPTLSPLSPSVDPPLDISISSKSFDLRKLTLLRSLASSSGSHLEPREQRLVVLNQNVNDDHTPINQDTQESRSFVNQTFDRQSLSNLISPSSPFTSSSLLEAPNHSTPTSTNPPVLRSVDPISTQMAFDLLSNVTTPNTSLLEATDRSFTAPLHLPLTENVLVAAVKRSKPCLTDTIVHKEPRHVKRLRLAAAAANERDELAKTSDAAIGISTRRKEGSKANRTTKPRTGPKLRSLSAVAQKLNEALEKQLESELLTKRDLLGTDSERVSRSNILAGTTVLVLWKNVESLVNEYQANWIEKISSLGARIAIDISDDITHVIPDSPDFPNHLILKRFNVKHVNDLPTGIKFVNDHWIEHSHKATSRADEEAFLWFSSHRTTFGIGPTSKSPPGFQPSTTHPSPPSPTCPTRTIFHSPTIQH